MPEKSIKSLFADICEQAIFDGSVKFGVLSSIRRGPEHSERKPGLFYSRLPEDIKDRIKNELNSDHVQSSLRMMLACGNASSTFYEDNSNWIKEEMLKFETKLMKHGWQPNFSL